MKLQPVSKVRLYRV